MIPHSWLFLNLVLYLNIVFLSICQSACPNNCSTFSINRETNLKEFISCSIKTRSCPAKNISGTTSKPVRIHAKTRNEWYLYTDPNNQKYQKIALNFSWSPNDDASIEYLQGYSIKLRKPAVLKKKQFCLNQNLFFHEHIKAEFFYDCFGFSDNLEIFPDEEWIVSIRNIPQPFKDADDQKLTFKIKIPSCDHPKMKNIYECYQKKLFAVSVLNQSCENRSFTILYNVPPMIGSTANVLLGYKIRNSLIPTEITSYRSLSPNGTLHLKLPMQYNFSLPYIIRVSGNIQKIYAKDLTINLTSCIIENYSKDIDSFPIIVIIVIIVSIAIITIIVFVGIYIRYCHKKIEDNSDVYRQNQNCQDDERKLLAKLENKKLITVYIVFVDDHPLHKQIVSSFASFLGHDLGFNVVSELYQTKKIYENLVGWMEKSFTQSDKVIIIWSPKALQRWQLQNDNVIDKNDIFTPVVNRIRNDLFLGKDALKYFFVYFDYCSKQNIPSEFIDKYSVTPFRLMHQIEELYFRLQGIEMYAPGAVIKQEKVDFHKYHDPRVNRCGPELHDNLIKMCEYVKNQPFWYNNDSNLSNASNTKENAFIKDYEIKKNYLNIVPPTVSISYSLKKLETDCDPNHNVDQRKQLVNIVCPENNDSCLSSVNSTETFLDNSSCSSEKDSSSEVVSNTNSKEILEFVENKDFDLACSKGVTMKNLSTQIRDQTMDSTKPIVQNLLQRQEQFDNETGYYTLDNSYSKTYLHSEKIKNIQASHESYSSNSSATANTISYSQGKKRLQVVVPLVPFEQNNDPMQSLMLINQQSGHML